MRKEVRKTLRHLFICTHTRECGDFCSKRNSEELVSRLKNRLKKESLWDDFKVSKSGCLGPCAFGISGILFPENILLSEIELSDEDKVYQLLVNKEGLE